MNLLDAQCFAQQKMQEHGLNDWKFQWSRGKRVFGFCSPRTKTIALSSILARINSEEQVKDTILHELAHALDWVRNKKSWHGYSWKRICVEVGAKPERCYKTSEVETVKPKYLLIHKDTKEVFCRYHRMPKCGTKTEHLFIRSKREETKGKLVLVRA